MNAFLRKISDAKAVGRLAEPACRLSEAAYRNSLRALRLLVLALVMLGGTRPAAASASDRFSGIGSDYKKPVELPDTFFNPFKNQSAGSALARKEAASVTNDLVTAAIGTRGVSGLIYSPDPQTDRVVVGDQVFGIGDELTFPDPDKPDYSPLVAGAAVVLREVRADYLQFEITPEGGASRHLVFSLRGFWRK